MFVQDLPRGVSRPCRRDCFRRWRLGHDCLDFGVLGGGKMHPDMTFVVLMDKRLDGLARYNRHVFRYWVHRLHFIIQRDYLVGVIYAHRIDHLPVKLLLIIYMRGRDR